MRIKRKTAFALLIVLVLLGIYLIMLFNTNQVVEDVKAVIYGQVNQTSIDAKLDYFNFTRGYADADVSLSMHRIFVLCGIDHGYIWVRYSYDVQSEEGNIDSGGYNIISRWEIEKVNGQWKIIDIFEVP